MNLEQIRAALQALRSRLSERMEELRSFPVPSERTDEHAERAAAIDTELNVAHEDGAERGLLDEIEHLEAQEATMVRAQDAVERGGVEHGADRGVPGVNVPQDPFDLDSLRVSPLADRDEVAGQLRSRALSAVEHIRTEDDAHRDRMTELLENHDGAGVLARRVLQCGSPLYERAFSNYLAGRPLVGDEARALAVGVGADGGFAVPVALDPTIILTSDGSVNPLRQIARVETITTKEWQGVTSAGITVTRKAEAAEATDDAPTLAQPTVTPTRVDAFVPFSYEVDQDWPQLRSEMTRLIAEAKDDEEAASFVTGDGTGNNPGGVVATLNASSHVNTAANNTFAAGDVYAVDNALPERFRARAQWIANKVTYNSIRQFASADGHDLWARLGEGRPPAVLGYPARESSAMATGTTTGTLILLLGDFRHFLIVDRVGMSVELVPHLFGANRRPTGQRGIFAYWRNSSVVLADNAFRLLRVNGV